MEAGLLKKWESAVNRHDELTTQLMDPSVISQPALLVKLTKERTELEGLRCCSDDIRTF
jgi:peptide chain release factor 1